MTPNSISYLLIALLFSLIFYFIPKKIKVISLLSCSLIFYYFLEPKFYFVLIILLLITYFVGLLLGQHKFKEFRFYVLLFYLSVMILIYFPFKYPHNHFILSTFFLKKTGFHLFLPLGISFFTFECLSYVLDIYYEKILPTKNLIKFSLYLCFFPRLVCGPIERASVFIPQIENGLKLTMPNVMLAICYLISGVFKKFIIANNIIFYNDFFNHPIGHSRIEWIIFSSISRYHLFLDFSGYTDIALGLGLLFGLKLTNNFARPFSAITIDEFWRKWHISLSTWIRDYVFYPIMTYAKKQIHIYFALIFSFLILGLWHGDNGNYLIYGLLNGLAIVGSLIFKKKVLDIKKSKVLNTLTWFFTFVFFISIPTLFLKSSSLAESFYMISQIFGKNNLMFKVSHESELIFLKLMPFLVLIVLYEMWSFYESKFLLFKKIESLPRIYLIPIVLVFWGLLMVAYSFNVPHAKFIYQGF